MTLTDRARAENGLILYNTICMSSDTRNRAFGLIERGFTLGASTHSTSTGNASYRRLYSKL